MLTKRFGGVTFSIDRPRGFVKRWPRPDGTEKVYTYPVDYGFFPNLRAEDGEGLDAFVGNDLHGHFESFEKLKPEGSSWVHDEFKFLVGVTDAERAEIYRLYPSHEVNARRIYPDLQTLVRIAHAVSSPARVKAAALRNPFYRVTPEGERRYQGRVLSNAWDQFEKQGALLAISRLS
jgi:hypothetical protein